MDNADSDAASDGGTSATDVAPADEGRMSGATLAPPSSNSSFHTGQLEASEAEADVDAGNVHSLPDADASHDEQAETEGFETALDLLGLLESDASPDTPTPSASAVTTGRGPEPTATTSHVAEICDLSEATDLNSTKVAASLCVTAPTPHTSDHTTSRAGGHSRHLSASTDLPSTTSSPPPEPRTSESADAFVTARGLKVDDEAIEPQQVVLTLSRNPTSSEEAEHNDADGATASQAAGEEATEVVGRSGWDVPDVAASTYTVLLAVVATMRISVGSVLYLLLFLAHCALLSMRRKHHQCYVVQAGGALSAVVLCYQITISMIVNNTVDSVWGTLGICGKSLVSCWYCCFFPDVVVLAASIVLWLLRTRYESHPAATRTQGEAAATTSTPAIETGTAVASSNSKLSLSTRRRTRALLEAAQSAALLVAGTVFPAVLPSAYVITLVGTTHQQLHTTGLERSMLTFLQAGTAVQLILTFTIQFLEPTAPKLLWQALAMLMPIDVRRVGFCCVSSTRYWICIAAQMFYVGTVAWYQDLTLPGFNRAEQGEQSGAASLWGPLATVVQIIQTYRSTSVNIVIIVWALVYPGLLTTPLLIVGLLTAQMRTSSMHSREHTVTRQAPRELHQIHRRRVPISSPHAMLLPYLMALVVVEYVWYMHEMHFGTRRLWRRLGCHVTEQAFWSLAPKTSLLLLLLWLIHPTWFERFLEIASLKYPALQLKTTHSFRKHLQGLISARKSRFPIKPQSAAAGATGEKPPLRKRLVSWMYDHVEHAAMLWEDKVLTASSKYSTMWLNVMMFGMWVLVIVLVLWLVAEYPSGMNAINLSFVIHSTFNHKEAMQRQWLIKFLWYLNVSIVLRYVWQYVAADVPQKSSHVVRGVGLEDYLAGKPFWWPIVLTQLSYHLLLFGLVCFQAALLDKRMRARHAQLTMWGTAKRSWTSWVCSKLDSDVTWLSFLVLVLTLGAFRPVQGHAVLPCMVDLAFACTLLLRSIHSGPALSQRLMLQRRLQADMLHYVRFQYVYCLAVYLCQIPHVLEALIDGWAATGLDKALTMEDLGLYRNADSGEVLWGIVTRLVLLTVSILHYNLLEWQWRRLNWAARAMQSIFRTRRSRRLQSSVMQLLSRNNSSVTRNDSNALTHATQGSKGSLAVKSSDISGGDEGGDGDGGVGDTSSSGTGNYIAAMQGGAKQSVVTLRALLAMAAIAWGSMRDAMHSVAGSEYFLVVVTALKLSLRLNFVGLVWTVVLVLVLRRHAAHTALALRRAHAAHTAEALRRGPWAVGGGNRSFDGGEEGGEAAVTIPPTTALRAPRLWASVVTASTAMMALLYVYQLSVFQSGGALAPPEGVRHDAGWLGLYQLSDARLLGVRVPSRMCCPAQFALQRIDGTDGEQACVRQDVGGGERAAGVHMSVVREDWAAEPFECDATVRGLYWLLQLDWLLLAACFLQKLSAQRNAAQRSHFSMLVKYHSRHLSQLHAYLSSPSTAAAPDPHPYPQEGSVAHDDAGRQGTAAEIQPSSSDKAPPPLSSKDGQELWWKERFFHSLSDSSHELTGAPSSLHNQAQRNQPSAAKPPPSGGGLTIRMPSLDPYTSREIIMVSPTAESPSHGSNEAWISAALEMGVAPGGMTGLPAIGEMVGAAGGPASHSATTLTATAQLHKKLSRLSQHMRTHDDPTNPSTPALAATPASRLLGMALVSIVPLWRSRYWRSRHLAVLSYHLTLLCLLLAALMRLNASSLLYVALLWAVAVRGSKRRREALAMYRGSWLLTSTLAVVLVLQYAYALGLPPSVYTQWGIMDGWLFQRERGYDVHGQLLCETCVRRKFYLYLRGCACDGNGGDGGECVLEPCAPVGLSASNLLLDFLTLFFAMHFVIETQKSNSRDDAERDDALLGIVSPAQQSGRRGRLHRAASARAGSQQASSRALDAAEGSSVDRTEGAIGGVSTARLLSPSVSLQLAEAEVAAAPHTSDWWDAVTLRAMHSHIYVVMAVLVLVVLLAIDTSVLSLGYLLIFVLYLCFFDKVICNQRIFQQTRATNQLSSTWWNPKMFTLLMAYNYLVLALKLLFCVPEVSPLFLDWTTSGPEPHGESCVRGTEGCELITEILGVRKLGDTCDGLSCERTFSVNAAGTLAQVLLCCVLYVQRQVMSNPRYLDDLRQADGTRALYRRGCAARHAAHLLSLQSAAERRLVMQLKFRKRVMRSLTELVGRVREWDSQLFGSQRDLFPPLPPSRPTAAVRSPTSVLVSWQEPPKLDARLPVLSYTVTRQMPQNFTFLGDYGDPMLVPGMQTSVLVSDLQAATGYQFRVVATNAEGSSIPSVASAVVVTKRLRKSLKSPGRPNHSRTPSGDPFKLEPSRVQRRASGANLMSLQAKPDVPAAAVGDAGEMLPVTPSTSTAATTNTTPREVVAVGTVAGLTGRRVEDTGKLEAERETNVLPSAAAADARKGADVPAAVPSSPVATSRAVAGATQRTSPVGAGDGSRKRTGTLVTTSVTDESLEAQPQGLMAGLKSELGKAAAWLHSELWSGLLNHVNPVLFPDRMLQAQKLGLIQLATMALRSNTAILCWVMMVVNVMVNANLLACLFPLAMFLVALLDSPTCDYKVWRAFLVYLGFVMLLKVAFELPVFCMQTHDYAQYSTVVGSASASKADASLLDSSRWWASVQPHCPVVEPYDPAQHAAFAKSAAVLFLVKKPRGVTLIRWLLADVLLFAALLFHSYHVQMLGCWEDDAYVTVHPPRHPQSVTRFGTSAVGRALNHCELVVRRFYHRIFRSDEILVDPIVLERAMRGETKTESGSGGGGGGGGSGVEAGNGGSRDGGSATASSPPQQVAYQWVRHQKGGNMHASRSAEEGGMSRAHVGKPGVDLYLPLFFSQCLIGIYFLSVLDRLNTNVDSFGQGLASNQFPMEVILVFLLWVTLLIVERIAYLNGHIQFKLMLHYATVLLGHWFVFFESPLNSLNPLHTFRSSGYLQVLYLLLLLYYTLSALQIRHGYLQGAQYGIAAMKLGTGPLSRIAWNIYMHFPFLFEARTILDWTCTSTSLDLFMWFTVEWSYAGFFKNKLVMAVRQEKKAVYTGNRSTLLVDKLLFGVLWFAVIMLVLVLPMMMFSSLNPGLAENRVTACTAQLVLETHYGHFELWRQRESRISRMNSEDYDTLVAAVGKVVPTAHGEECIVFDPFSEQRLQLTQAALDLLVERLYHGSEDDGGGSNIIAPTAATLMLKVDVTREGPPGMERIFAEYRMPMNATQQFSLRRMLSGELDVTLAVPGMYPRAIHLPAGATVAAYDTVRPRWLGLNLRVLPDGDRVYFSVTNDALPGANATSDGASDGYCAAPAAAAGQKGEEETAAAVVGSGGGGDEAVDPMGPVITALNDHYAKGIVETLGLASYRIVGVYALVLITVNSMVRRILMKTWSDIFIRELQDSSDLLELCSGFRQLHSLQYAGRFKDEVKLYSVLIQILQNPEYMVKVTRPRDREMLLNPDDHLSEGGGSDGAGGEEGGSGGGGRDRSRVRFTAH